MDTEYWKQHDPPMSFVPEGWSYEKKRRFRYQQLDYLWYTADFSSYRGKRVLCVGDGAGIDAAEFANYDARVSVIDISQKAIDLTKALFHETGLTLDAAYVGDMCDLSCGPTVRAQWTDDRYEIGEIKRLVGGCRFDLVYAFGVVHHIENAAKAVSEAHRVLAPGGTFMGMVYNKDSVLYAYSIMSRAVKEGISPEAAMHAYSERNPGCPYSKAYTEQELVELLDAFETKAISKRYPVIDVYGERKVKFKLSNGCEDAFGWHLFFKAKKCASP